MKVLVSLLPCLFCLNYSVYAFVPTSFRRVTLQCESQLRVSVTQEDVRYQDYQLTDEQVKPIVRLGKGDKEKVINLYGLSCVAVTLLTCPFWGASMSLLKMIHEMNPEFDTNRELYDRTGKIWSRLWLSMTGSYPTFSGNIEELRRGQGPCLYVANHASWLDIPIICTVLDPVFKFIAKAELAQLPCIGQQLKGGDHILIDRDDRRSQLKTFKDGIGWLRKGVPIMAFPEGKRSTDGRLMDFKGGLFSMAVKTNVPIIPITIGHANAVMPGNSLFPVQPGGGKLHVHVHEAIDTAGKTDDELVQLVRAAFLSTLPFNQHPQDEKIESTDSEPGIKSLTVHASSTHHQPSLVQQHHQLHAPDATMLHHDKLHHVKNVPFFIANNKEEERETVSK